ncbi:hypothetical protein SAMN02910456_02005 [Ruminococcaceae bacterium YRB3002]|nr:hypothetical protein SAMN02910456_02005 [Ruminococcaceae bacterium YRB3002]
MKKALIIIFSITAVIICIILLMFVPRDVSVVTTTSGFISTSYHCYDTNPLLKIKVRSIHMDEDKYRLLRENDEKTAEYALNEVLAFDSDAFHGEYTSASRCVAVVGDYIYYYRTSDPDHVYKMNRSTGNTAACNLSGYDSFSSAEMRDSYTEVDNNYTTFRSILTEGLIDTYPGLKKAIESLDGEFYYSYMYYTNGRIFFDVRNTIYEYLPDKDKVSKVATVGAGETIEMIRCQ